MRGELRLDGEPIHPASPAAAQRLGISTVYQEVNLCPNLSVAENIFAGPLSAHGARPGCGASTGRACTPTRARCSRACNLRHRRDAAAVELPGGGAADGRDRARAQRRGARC